MVKKLRICLLVLTEYKNVTDRRTDTAQWHRPRLCIASRGKNITIIVDHTMLMKISNVQGFLKKTAGLSVVGSSHETHLASPKLSAMSPQLPLLCL